MKTHVLHLERHDDLVSTRDKMSWANADRILVVWPPHTHMLDRRLDLMMLQRHSRALGAELAIVSGDRVVLENALALGIPTFRSAEKARRRMWRKPTAQQNPIPERKFRGDLRSQRPESRYNHNEMNPALRLFFFSLGMLAFLALGAVLLPSARIQIALPVETQQTVLSISARPGLALNLAGSIPYTLKKTSISGTGQGVSSGWMDYPGEKASGRVEFSNLTAGALTVPAGTVVIAPDSGRRFTTRESVKVPPKLNGKVSVEIIAAAGGEGGNLPAHSITAIEGSVGLQASVTNPAATIGGSDLQVHTPIDADIQKLRQELMAELRQEASARLSTEEGDGYRIIPNSLSPGEVISMEVSPGAGTPADAFTMRLQIEFSAAEYDQNAVEDSAGAALDSSLPSGRRPLPLSLKVEDVGDPTLAEGGQGIYTWQVNASRLVSQPLPKGRVLSMVTARDKAASVQSLLAEFPEAVTAQVQTIPAWWPLMPALPFRIEIQDLNLEPGGGGQG